MKTIIRFSTVEYIFAIARSGTVPTPLVVGLGEAASVAKAEMANDKAHVDRLSKKLIEVRLSIKTIHTNCIANL